MPTQAAKEFRTHYERQHWPQAYIDPTSPVIKLRVSKGRRILFRFKNSAMARKEAVLAKKEAQKWLDENRTNLEVERTPIQTDDAELPHYFDLIFRLKRGKGVLKIIAKPKR